MKILEQIARWKDDALLLAGFTRNAAGKYHHNPEDALTESRYRAALRQATDDQLRAWQAIGAEVAAVLGTKGWQHIVAEQEEADKRLLENFIDGTCDSWDKTLQQQGAVRQHRARGATAYQQVRLGIRAEQELELRQRGKTLKRGVEDKTT